MKKKFLCFIGRHQWTTHQGLLWMDIGFKTDTSTVICFRVCERCAKSKLVHLLR